MEKRCRRKKLLLPVPLCWFAFACSCCFTHPPVHMWGHPAAFCPAQSAQSLGAPTALPRAQGLPRCGVPDADAPASPSGPLTSLCTRPPAPLACILEDCFPTSLPQILGQASPCQDTDRFPSPSLSLPTHLGSLIPGRAVFTCLATVDQLWNKQPNELLCRPVGCNHIFSSQV